MAGTTRSCSEKLVNTITFRAGKGASQLPGRLHPVHSRHDQIHQDHIRLEPGDLLQGALAVRRLADHLDLFFRFKKESQSTTTTAWSSTSKTVIGRPSVFPKTSRRKAGSWARIESAFPLIARLLPRAKPKNDP